MHEAVTADGHDASRKLLLYTDEFFIETEFDHYLFKEFFPFMLVRALKDDPVLRTCLNAKGLAILAKIEEVGVEAARPAAYVQSPAVATRLLADAAAIAAASAAKGNAGGAADAQ